MAIRIDWNKLMKTQEGERTVFEQFCRHVILRRFKGYGIEEPYYNTPGSETYILLTKSMTYEGKRLKVGDVIGWQAKDWRGKDQNNSSLSGTHKDELEKGFKAAVGFKGDALKLWILCTPGDFHQKAYASLESRLSGIKSNCTIVRWSKGTFESFYINERDRYNGIFQYYFDGQFLGKRIVESVTKDTLEKLKEKYLVHLHVPTRQEKELLSIVDENVAKAILTKKIKEIVDAVQEDRENIGLLNKEAVKRSKISAKYVSLYNKRLKELYGFADKLAKYKQIEDVIDKSGEILTLIDNYKTKQDAILDDILAELRRLAEKTEDKEIPASVFVFTESHKMRVPNIEKLIMRHEKGNLNLEQIVNLVSKRIHAVFAEPGQGKTHFACSIADTLTGKGLPVLFLQGHDFRNEKTITNILIEKLNLSSNPSLDDIMDMLEFMGDSQNSRLPIIIDGLDETDPKSARWKDDLPELKRRVREKKHLMFVTTCRSNSNYLRVIYGREYVSDIYGAYELGAMDDKDTERMVRKYFDAYEIKPNTFVVVEEFRIPLLLRIFCEANKGRMNFDIQDTPLVAGIEAYSNYVVEKVANKEQAGGYEMRVYDIRKGIGDFSQELWDGNKTDILYVPDFYNKFTKEEYAEKIVDEGCCSTDIEGEETYVHFTYKLIAGFHIAKWIVDNHTDKEDLVSYLQANKSMLLGTPRHVYAEDIIKSLIYLLLKKHGLQLHEVIPSVEAANATIDNLEDVLATSAEQHALLQLTTYSAFGEEQTERLCQNLYRRVLLDRNLSHFSEFIPLFESMMPREIDEYWNSRFVEYQVLERMQDILHDDYMYERYQWEDIISCNAMLCGIADQEFREIFHTLLFNKVLCHYKDVESALFERLLRMPDAYVFESMVTVLTGVGLRSEDKEVVRSVVGLLERYMQEYTSNSVILLDALDTMYRYCEYRWGENYDRKIMSKNKDEEWPTGQIGNVTTLGVFDYDFDKYNIRPLYEKSYRPITDVDFTKDEIYGMLSERCKHNGYVEDIYKVLEERDRELAQSRSRIRKAYGYKHVRFALSELYGWLIVNGHLKPAYKDTYRVGFLDIDPSSPRLPEKWSLVSKSYMPESVEELETWMKKDDTRTMEELFVRQLPNHEGEWVMLHGRFGQIVKNKCAEYDLTGCVEINPSGETDEVILQKDMTQPAYLGHIYAGELGWRILEPRDPEWDSEDSRRILADYSFTSESENKFTYQSHICLRTSIAMELGLRYDVNTMAYYDKDGRQASVYYINDSDQFFYVRKDLVEKLMAMKDVSLRLHIYESRMAIGNSSHVAAMLKKFEDRRRDVIYRNI